MPDQGEDRQKKQGLPGVAGQAGKPPVLSDALPEAGASVEQQKEKQRQDGQPRRSQHVWLDSTPGLSFVLRGHLVGVLAT
jgi:hypothetical protein